MSESPIFFFRCEMGSNYCVGKRKLLACLEHERLPAICFVDSEAELAGTNSNCFSSNSNFGEGEGEGIAIILLVVVILILLEHLRELKLKLLPRIRWFNAVF